MPLLPDITNFKGSTNLNSAIQSYDQLVKRVYGMLGAPTVSIEVCPETIYDFINQAIEWFQKYAGYTTEYLVFDSKLYEPGLGVKLDRCFSYTPEMHTTSTTGVTGLSGSFDYDLNTYRKVVDVFSVAEGENSGINSLFTLEQGMAQQVYSTFMLGNVGFDLVTWHALKNWLDDRGKMLGQMVYFRFNPMDQYLRLVPEPRIASTQGSVHLTGGSYYGLIGCYVERPIKDLVHERWVQRYTLALTKIALGHIRGKFGSTALFGGGTINGQDMMSQGLDEKDKLETELMTGHGEVEPACFFVG